MNILFFHKIEDYKAEICQQVLYYLLVISQPCTIFQILHAHLYMIPKIEIFVLFLLQISSIRTTINITKSLCSTYNVYYNIIFYIQYVL